MPRLLPKLLRGVRPTVKDRSLKRIPQSRVKNLSLPKALPFPSFSPSGREQSILLDDVNPVMHHDAYTHRKSLSPTRPSVVRRGVRRDVVLPSREMTERECEWWSNPYLRMLASPLRNCLVTESIVPADFTIRLAALEVTDSRFVRPISALLPDGVEHPRFRRRTSGRGIYITCHKNSINELQARGNYKRIPTPSPLQFHSLLATQIAHQLRLRVLQELELLTEVLKSTPQESLENIILRRLTRTEWTEIKTNGCIAQPGAVAILVVPPLNKIKNAELPNNNREEPPLLPLYGLPPVSVLHETTKVKHLNPFSQATSQIPLYNGLALFPSRPMRQKLHQALQTALHVERQARWRQGRRSNTPSHKENTEDKTIRDKPSHAYLLRSDARSIRRGDSVPLAIALWKIRMWESPSYETDLES